jgi:hypothetical protein
VGGKGGGGGRGEKEIKKNWGLRPVSAKSS